MTRAFRSTLASTAMLCLLASCGAPSPTADQSPPGSTPQVATPDARNPAGYHDDENITQRVQAAVVAVPGVHAHNLHISTLDGVVTLRGTASHEDAARNAIQAARQTTGVRSVEYDLLVQPY